MERKAAASLFAGALVLAWMLAGCGDGGQQAAPPGGTGATPPGATAPSTAAAALGSEQSAGPFQVTLTTDPDTPKAGDTKFEAKVTRNGQPVKDATVNLSLSMPSMKMMGPEVSLKARPEGTRDEYEGTANLSMGGEWEAKTTVSAGSESGTAVYGFSASQ